MSRDDEKVVTCYWDASCMDGVGLATVLAEVIALANNVADGGRRVGACIGGGGGGDVVLDAAVRYKFFAGRWLLCLTIYFLSLIVFFTLLHSSFYFNFNAVR